MLVTLDKSRPLYHAAAVLAAGGQVALFAEAVRTFRDATGLTEPKARAVLLPLALGALEKLWHEPPERAITMIKAVAMRASTSSAAAASSVGDSMADRLAMIVRWCAARYYRVD